MKKPTILLILLLAATQPAFQYGNQIFQPSFCEITEINSQTVRYVIQGFEPDEIVEVRVRAQGFGAWTQWGLWQADGNGKITSWQPPESWFQFRRI